MKINRVFARANHQTFKIKPITKLLERYVKGLWIDPFAGANSPATITNDINPNMPTHHHLDAQDFAKLFHLDMFDGVLFDPPYSYRQITEHYKSVGIKANFKDTSYNFYRRVMKPLAKQVKKGGYAISFGWNSNGFGKVNGFEIVKILLVAHGLHHNDTICTVEIKK